MAMADALLAAVAPVFKVDGTPAGEVGQDLLRVEIEHTTRGLATLRAQLQATPTASGVDGESIYLDGSVLDFGGRLEVSIGPPGDERIVFRGAVSAIEATFEEAHSPRVSVFAEDELMALRMTRRTRTYRHSTDAAIARAIADAHKLQASATADGPTYDLVQQANTTDLAFLRERARRVQAELWVEDGTLHFASRAQRAGTDVTLVRGRDLLAVQVRADLAHQRSRVRVSGYDAQRRQPIDEVADDGAIRAETSGGRSGPAVLERAFGRRDTQRVRDVPLAGAEAAAWARAEMLRRSRSFVTVVGTTNGTPQLAVGSRVTLDRVGAVFGGPAYYATRVTHTYDLRSGHRTHFEAERPTVGGDTT
jgi:phage protein D